MGEAGVAMRHQLLLWAAVVAIALSLLAMHQLSSNHTAADPSAADSSADSASAMSMAVTFSQADGPHQQAGAEESDHSHLAYARGDGHPASEGTSCPGCTGHHAMALTCLAALILLIVGWVLARPLERRGMWLRRPVPLRSIPAAFGRLRPPSLVELSVSRT